MYNRQDDLQIIHHSARIEALLEPFKQSLGEDFKAYRGHIYRTVTYAMYFLDYDEQARPLIETAFAYHDIGLWTKPTLAYLEPSEALALEDNQKYGWGLDPDALRAIIHWHHKITPYTGPHEKLVEAARRADWIDASNGIRRMGLSKSQIKSVEDAIPSYDFAEVLQRLAGDLGGNRLFGNLKVLATVFKF